jgi:hypothetical protein
MKKSFPVYRLEEDLMSILTKSNVKHSLKITHENSDYKIVDFNTNGCVFIEKFSNHANYMIMIYAGNLAENRNLAVIVEEMIIASGGRKVMGEELDQVLA